MTSAVEQMKSVLDSINFLEFKIPMISNFNAKKFDDKFKVKDLLLDQLTSPVLWHQSVSYLNSKLGVDEFLEVGPKNVLSGLIKRIAKDSTVGNFGEKADLEKI